MADTKFMNFAEVIPSGTDSVLVGNSSNGVRRAQLSNLKAAIGGIVEESLGENGYIKYASGVILQWGRTFLYTDKPNTIEFPISFSSENICINLTSKKYDSGDTTFHRSAFVDVIENNRFMAYPTQNGYFMWFAIGY